MLTLHPNFWALQSGTHYPSHTFRALSMFKVAARTILFRGAQQHVLPSQSRSRTEVGGGSPFPARPARLTPPSTDRAR